MSNQFYRTDRFFYSLWFTLFVNASVALILRHLIDIKSQNTWNGHWIRWDYLLLFIQCFAFVTERMRKSPVRQHVQCNGSNWLYLDHNILDMIPSHTIQVKFPNKLRGFCLISFSTNLRHSKFTLEWDFYSPKYIRGDEEKSSEAKPCTKYIFNIAI